MQQSALRKKRLLADVLIDNALERAVSGQLGKRLVDLFQKFGVFLGDGDGVILNGVFRVEDVQALDRKSVV